MSASFTKPIMAAAAGEPVEDELVSYDAQIHSKTGRRGAY